MMEILKEVEPPGQAVDAGLTDAEYEEPVRACVRAIEVGQLDLIRRCEDRSFNPAEELDYTKNGAMILNEQLFECVGKYEEGRVPFWVLGPYLRRHVILVNRLRGRKDAQMMQLDRAERACAKLIGFVSVFKEKPDMSREVYLKRYFRRRDEFFGMLDELHEAYVSYYLTHRVRARKPKKSFHQRMKESDRNFIVGKMLSHIELTRCSRPHAVEVFRRNPQYAHLFGDLPDATWVRYLARYAK